MCGDTPREDSRSPEARVQSDSGVPYRCPYSPR